MHLATVVLAVLLAFTCAENRNDGNCSPELIHFASQISKFGQEAGAMSNEYAPMVYMAKRMAKRYFGDHIPWKKMKAFSLRTSETCILRNCFTIQRTFTSWVHKFQPWLNGVMEKGKNKTTFEPTTVFLDLIEGVQQERDHYILRNSEKVMPLFDQLNYFANKMIRDTSNFESQSLLELAEKMPCNILDAFIESPITNATIGNMLPVLLRSAQKKMLKEGMVGKLREELERLYDEACNSKITMIRTLFKDMPKKDFMELVDRFTDSVGLLLLSPEVGPGVMLVMKAAVEKLRSIDVDRSWSQGYLFLLRQRSLHQRLDVEMFIMEVHRFALSFQKGWWLLETGRWPAMEKYLRKLARTITSDAFWERADRHLNRAIHIFEATYKQREGDLADFIVDSVHPMLISAIAYIERFSNQVDVSFQRIADDISSWDTDNEEPSMWQSITERATRQYVACGLKKQLTPEFFMLGMNGRSQFKDVFMDLFFSGWPEHKRKPPGADKFFERMTNFVKNIVTSVYGECFY